MGLLKLFKPLFSTRRKRTFRRKHKNRRTRKHRGLMRGGWGGSIPAPTQPNVMRGGWGSLPPNM